MISMNRFTKAAAVAVVGLSLAVPAAASAADRRGENALIGGLVGAIAGGLIGGDATGAIVGAGAGALLGASSSRGHDYRARYDRRYQPSYGYRGPQRGYGYATPTRYGAYDYRR